MTYILILLSSILVNNFVLTRFLGICPFLGVSKKTETALGMGFAVIFVMAIASFFTYAIYAFILLPFGYEYLSTIIFVLVIAGLVQVVEMVIKRFTPMLYATLGVYLPLITTNCAVLGVAILNITECENILQALVNGIGSGIGFTLALVLMAGIREKLLKSDIHPAFAGFPLTLVIASIMAMAFGGLAMITF